MQSHQVFVDNVHRLMHEQNLSLKALADLMGTDSGSVSKYIGGMKVRTPIEQLSQPTLDKIDQFARALGVIPEVLIHQELVAA